METENLPSASPVLVDSVLPVVLPAAEEICFIASCFGDMYV